MAAISYPPETQQSRDGLMARLFRLVGAVSDEPGHGGRARTRSRERRRAGLVKARGKLHPCRYGCNRARPKISGNRIIGSGSQHVGGLEPRLTMTRAAVVPRRASQLSATHFACGLPMRGLTERCPRRRFRPRWSSGQAARAQPHRLIRTAGFEPARRRRTPAPCRRHRSGWRNTRH